MKYVDFLFLLWRPTDRFEEADEARHKHFAKRGAGTRGLCRIAVFTNLSVEAVRCILLPHNNPVARWNKLTYTSVSSPFYLSGKATTLPLILPFFPLLSECYCCCCRLWRKGIHLHLHILPQKATEKAFISIGPSES
jgi:hypothetical protein